MSDVRAALWVAVGLAIWIIAAVWIAQRVDASELADDGEAILADYRAQLVLEELRVLNGPYTRPVVRRASTSRPSYGGGTLTNAQVTRIIATYFPAGTVAKAKRVAWCESKWRPRAQFSRS